MYRRATGHAGLTPADADAIVATAMRALASWSLRAGPAPERHSDAPSRPADANHMASVVFRGATGGYMSQPKTGGEFRSRLLAR
jgi:hypothetical protein